MIISLISVSADKKSSFTKTLIKKFIKEYPELVGSLAKCTTEQITKAAYGRQLYRTLSSWLRQNSSLDIRSAETMLSSFLLEVVKSKLFDPKVFSAETVYVLQTGKTYQPKTSKLLKNADHKALTATLKSIILSNVSRDLTASIRAASNVGPFVVAQGELPVAGNISRFRFGESVKIMRKTVWQIVVGLTATHMLIEGFDEDGETQIYKSVKVNSASVDDIVKLFLKTTGMKAIGEAKPTKVASIGNKSKDAAVTSFVKEFGKQFKEAGISMRFRANKAGSGTFKRVKPTESEKAKGLIILTPASSRVVYLMASKDAGKVIVLDAENYEYGYLRGQQFPYSVAGVAKIIDLVNSERNVRKNEIDKTFFQFENTYEATRTARLAEQKGKRPIATKKTPVQRKKEALNYGAFSRLDTSIQETVLDFLRVKSLNVGEYELKGLQEFASKTGLAWDVQLIKGGNSDNYAKVSLPADKLASLREFLKSEVM